MTEDKCSISPKATGKGRTCILRYVSEPQSKIRGDEKLEAYLAYLCVDVEVFDKCELPSVDLRR